MKKLYLVGGTMGVGKTTVCQQLKNILSNSVFLDGDWCWDSNPFQVTDETKEMVMDNICHMLNNFLKCSVYDNIIFCWVMHQQEIIDGILEKLDLTDCSAYSISLTCTPDVLKERLERDISNGIRTSDAIDKSISYLPLYRLLYTKRIDTTNISPGEVAEILAKL